MQLSSLVILTSALSVGSLVIDEGSPNPNPSWPGISDGVQPALGNVHSVELDTRLNLGQIRAVVFQASYLWQVLVIQKPCLHP